VALDLSDFERVRAALDFMPADDYQVWLNVGMVIKARFGEEGRALWDLWSKMGHKYDARVQDKKWRSFFGSGVGLGTLFELAKRREGIVEHACHCRPL
jgi:putative DNA primase/helicase